MLSRMTLAGFGPPPNWNKVSFALKQLLSIHAFDGVNSPMASISPVVSSGDQWMLAFLTDSGLALTPAADGNVSYPGGGDTRQHWLNALYDLSLLDWYPTDQGANQFSIYVNNHAPVGSSVPAQFWYTHLTITPLVADSYVSDGDSDTFADSTLSISGTLNDLSWDLYTDSAIPPNTTMRISGIPETAGSGNLSAMVTDIAGASVNLTIPYIITEAVQVPEVGGGGITLSSGLATLEAVAVTTDVIYVVSGSVTPNNIVSTLPLGGTWVIPYSLVQVSVSGTEIPDVSSDNPTLAAATAEAVGFGFAVSASYDVTSLLANGTVLSQLPAAGEIGAYGQVITLVVSGATTTGTSPHKLIPKLFVGTTTKGYARGSKAWGICGRCGLRDLLNHLVFDEYAPDMRVHEDCKDYIHARDRLPVVEDPIRLYKPSPDDGNSTAPVVSSDDSLGTGFQLGAFQSSFQSGAASTNQISLNWTRAALTYGRVEQYAVYVSTDGDDFSVIAQLPVTYGMLGEPETETLEYSYITGTGTYWYYVAAEDFRGRQTRSNTISVVVA